MSNYSLIQKGNPETIVAIAACHQGQMKSGVNNGWIGMLSPKLQESTFIDFRNSRLFDDPIKGSKLLGRNISSVMTDTSRVLTLGGDHTVSFGSISATLAQDPATRVIWVDAHPDINTPKSTLSGNCHGMPVAHLLGLVHNQFPEVPLSPNNLVYVGLRDIDAAEQLMLDSISPTIFTADKVNKDSILNVLYMLSKKWKNKNVPIHISLDIDSIDPKFAPSTGTPVSGGLYPADVMELIKWAKENSSRLHLDLVEVNPSIGTLAQVNKTMSVTRSILDLF